MYSLTYIGFPKVDAIKADLGYYLLEGGQELEMVWSLEVDLYDHWYNAFVSARDLSIVAVFDWVNDLNTYEVCKFVSLIFFCCVLFNKVTGLPHLC